MSAGRKASDFQGRCYDKRPIPHVTTLAQAAGLKEKKVSDASIHIVRRRTQAISLDAALELARKSLSAKCTGADIEEFFISRGFFIKIAHPLESDDEIARPNGIDGMFALNDNFAHVSGIVVDARDNFRILLHPPPNMMHDEGSIAHVIEHIENYETYAAVDGTTITLYYAPRIGEWLYATARSYDARNYRWMGAKTFGEAIAECSGGIIAPGALDTTLDKNRAYSFIFRHPDFHLLAQDPMAIWQLSGPEIAGIQQFSTRVIRDAAEHIDELKYRADDSFNVFARSRASELNYGYVFERKAGVEEGAQKVYLESALHALIRQHIYDIPAGTTGIDFNTRALFMHLRAYMALGMPNTGGISHSAHLLMFPQASDIFSKMDFVIGTLTDLTTAAMRATKRATTMRHSDARDAIGREKFGASWGAVSARLDAIARGVSEKLLASGTINAFGDHVLRNIRDRYMSGDNLKVFVDLIHDATKE